MPSQAPLPMRFRGLRTASLILVPALALAGWLLLQPPDRMCPRHSPFFVSSLLYDEYDLSAMALRGLNAELGRKAGLTANPPGVFYHQFSRAVEAPRPLKDRYFLEYPHSMLLLFRAGFWIQPDWRERPMPPGLPDSGYHNIAAHEPESTDQEAFWRTFVVATRLYVGVMVVAWLLLILVLERGYTPDLRGGAMLLLLPAAIYFTLNRYDILPALISALGFMALGRKRPGLAGLALGVATLLKVYPILFAPLVLRYLWPRRGQAMRFLGVYVATGLLALHPLLLGEDRTGLLAPYVFQLTRPPEAGLTIYGCVLPVDFANGVFGSMFRLTMLGAISLAMLATPIRDLSGLLRRCAVVLMVFVSLAVFYSPQWILWFIPLLAPLVSRERILGVWAALLDGINYLTFPFWFWVLPEMIQYILPESIEGTVLSQVGNMLRLARFLVCGLIVLHLVRHEFPAVRDRLGRLRSWAIDWGKTMASRS